MKFNQKSLGYNHKITDWGKFAEYANKQVRGRTQTEKAELIGKVSRQTNHRAHKKMGYTRKKRPTDKRREAKKAEFLKIIATKAPENLVVIGGSGIDNTEDDPYGYCQKGQHFYALKF